MARKKSSCCKLHRTSKAGSLGIEMHSSYCFHSQNDIPELTLKDMKRMRKVTPEEHVKFSAAVKAHQEKNK
jgi:hypothetical protein